MSNVFSGGNKVKSVNGETGHVNVTEDKNYVYVQTTPTTSWTINHGLNKRPSVDVYDENDELIYCKVKNINNNQVVIVANTPFTGKAIFN